MDMSSSTETARWYDNPRLGGSPSMGHQNASGSVDASDMGALYALENSGHRRYYSGYAPHSKSKFIFILFERKK